MAMVTGLVVGVRVRVFVASSHGVAAGGAPSPPPATPTYEVTSELRGVTAKGAGKKMPGGGSFQWINERNGNRTLPRGYHNVKLV